MVVLTVLGVALAGGLCWVWWDARAGRGPGVAVPLASSPTFTAPAVSTSALAVPAVSAPAVDVLHDWDHRRARAYAVGDVAALRELYVAGSHAGTTDVDLLRDHRGRGLRIEGMRMQLLAVKVLERKPGLWRIRVTDRLHGAVVVGDGLRTSLPRDEASTRVITFRRGRGQPEWRVAAVVHSPRLNR
jgi:hypothetical protein